MPPQRSPEDASSPTPQSGARAKVYAVLIALPFILGSVMTLKAESMGVHWTTTFLGGFALGLAICIAALMADVVEFVRTRKSS